MPIKKTNSQATATVTFTVDGPESDIPVMLGAAYTYQGQKIYPVRVVAIWRRSDGESWRLEKVTVDGDVQTKSGARGKAWTDRRAWDGYGLDKSWTDDTPDWMMSAVMNNQPK